MGFHRLVLTVIRASSLNTNIATYVIPRLTIDIAIQNAGYHFAMPHYRGAVYSTLPEVLLWID